jgi:sugar phosphate isomerase/epimerase
MKLACQINLLPGEETGEKFSEAKEIGFEGIELQGKILKENPALMKEYAKYCRETGLKISTICAGYRNSLLSALPDERKTAVEDIKKLLEFGGQLAAVGLIVVPIFRLPQISDLSPYKTAFELEKELLLAELPEIAEHAEKNKCAVLLEPLNRYETHFINRLEQATEICKQINNPYLKIMADFFHMSIEETNIAASLRKNGKWIAHVHLADSNRYLPGLGHTDFETGFAALKNINYQNYMALECKVPEGKKENLIKSFSLMENILNKI